MSRASLLQGWLRQDSLAIKWGDFSDGQHPPPWPDEGHLPELTTAQASRWTSDMS